MKLLMQETNSTVLQKKFKTTGKHFDLDLIRKIQLVFLRKSEFHNQGVSILIGLFGIISMSISRKDLMQQTFFREKVLFWPLDNLGQKNYYIKTRKICGIVFFRIQLQQTF